MLHLLNKVPLQVALELITINSYCAYVIRCLYENLRVSGWLLDSPVTNLVLRLLNKLPRQMALSKIRLRYDMRNVPKCLHANFGGLSSKFGAMAH